MGYARWGMRGAQPLFQVNGRMVDAADLVKFEVCDAIGTKAANADEACYRLDIAGINHPDAHLIAAAPDLYEALKAMLAAPLYADSYYTEQVNPVIERAYAALKKARGESA